MYFTLKIELLRTNLNFLYICLNKIRYCTKFFQFERQLQPQIGLQEGHSYNQVYI